MNILYLLFILFKKMSGCEWVRDERPLDYPEPLRRKRSLSSETMLAASFTEIVGWGGGERRGGPESLVLPLWAKGQGPRNPPQN